MTARHLLEGVMQHTKARNGSHCSVLLGLDPATICRLNNGRNAGVNIATLDQIQRKTDIPFDMLFAWYRLPADAVLGRVREAA